MSQHELDDVSRLSMVELFHVEAENQTAVLTKGLLELERGPAAPEQLESLMRAAHSLKGAARIVDLQTAVRVAHAIEDCFALAQQEKLALRQPEIDLLFRGIDLLAQISKHNETSIARWEADHADELNGLLVALGALAPVPPKTAPDDGGPPAASAQAESVPDSAFPATTVPAVREAPQPVNVPGGQETPERVVRLTAENLNRLLGLAGESLVESRWLRPFADSLQRLKRHQTELSIQLNELHNRLSEEHLSERAEHQFNELGRKVTECQQFLTERMQELDKFDRRSAHLSQRLYLEVLRTRMRPFSDGVRRFPRMVRDLARALGKQVRLEILGENTQVDRDILERLESPLAHLLRNAVDHGCETPEQRQRAGKPPEGTIRLEARHSAGMLLVTVTDDGAGVQLERVREAIVTRGLATPRGRREAYRVRAARVSVPAGLHAQGDRHRDLRARRRPGRGAEHGPERARQHSHQHPARPRPARPTAVAAHPLGRPRLVGRGRRRALRHPLTQITRALKLHAGEHRNPGKPPPLSISAASRSVCSPPTRSSIAPGPQPPDGELPVVVLGDRNARYGLVVDRFLGEREWSCSRWTPGWARSRTSAPPR